MVAESGRSPVPGSGCQPTASAVPASRSGIPNAGDVDDAVEAWHNGAGPDLSLRQYLGWSIREYADWVFCSDLIPQRPLACAQGIDARQRQDAKRLDPKDESPTP